jgi:citrate lyase beta subunit
VSDEEIARAIEEARLFLEAEASGRGAIMIAGRMADRATDRVNRTTLKIASALGRLAPEVAAELGIK